MGDPSVPWDALVTGEAPELTRCGCNLSDGTRHKCQNDNERHDVGAGIGLCRVVEYLNERIACEVLAGT